MELVTGAIAQLKQWNERMQLTADLQLIQFVVRRAMRHVWAMRTGRVHYWYLFERSVRLYPDNKALSFARPTGLSGDEAFAVEAMTYQELYDQVLRLSEVLVHRWGVSKGDTVGLVYTNKPMFVILWLALWNVGALPAFVNYNTSGKPLAHCLEVAKVSTLLVDPACSANVQANEVEIKDSCPGIEIRYIDESPLMDEINNANSIAFRLEDDKRSIDEKDYDAALLIYTSGTTGLPKSAIMSWRKVGFGTSLYGYIVQLNSDDAVYTAMPLYHSTAAILGVCTAFNRGACVALGTKFSASTIWTQVKLLRATHLQYVGEVCRYLLNSPVHPDERNHLLRVAYGNGLRAEIWQQFKDRFNVEAIGEFYASTESPIALTSFQTGDVGVGACRNYGYLINAILQFQQTIIRMDPEDNSVELRDAAGFCSVAPVGEPGELIMNIFTARHPERMFQGYLGNKRETESKILRDVFHKGDAWFRSGDLLKSDERGFWYFVDRLGDTFRWKSENVSATEVEMEVSKVPGVLETVVVGLSVPNHEGRAGFAVVEKNASASETDILRDLPKVELPRYAVPIFVKFTEQGITHSDNHKVLKRAYREQQLPANDIYWLRNGRYVSLTPSDWEAIIGGVAKI